MRGASSKTCEWLLVALHQHMPASLAHAVYEKLDLEIGWRLPLAKHFEDSLVGILIPYWLLPENAAGARDPVPSLPWAYKALLVRTVFVAPKSGWGTTTVRSPLDRGCH